MAPCYWIAQMSAWYMALEVWAARLGRAAIIHLPRPLVLALARGLGTLAWLIDGRLRRVGRANLDLVFGDTLPAARKSEILRRSFQTFALTLLDLFWFSHRNEERIRRFVRFDQPPESTVRGGGIGVTAHYGNWELLGQAITRAGTTCHSVANPLKNPRVDDILCRYRRDCGQVIIPRQGAVRALLRHLRAGHLIALVMDQNTKLEEGGVFIDFFGVPATISTTPALLAHRTGCRVLFLFCVPRPDGTYLVTGYREAPPAEAGESDEAATARLMATLMRITEEQIRSAPEHWLWMYKRWKHIRPGDDPARYPFYSRPPRSASQAPRGPAPA